MSEKIHIDTIDILNFKVKVFKEENHVGNDFYGNYNDVKQEIVIVCGLSWERTYETLTHEICHAIQNIFAHSEIKHTEIKELDEYICHLSSYLCLFIRNNQKQIDKIVEKISGEENENKK